MPTTPNVPSAKPLISIVIPCLNEEKTIGSVIKEAKDGFERAGYPFEILVADNGSKDRSRAIARTAGARVIPVEKRGYGVALREGIRQARGEIVLFGDADLTYDFKQGPALVDRLLQGDVELVIGTRLKGSIEVGAMPLWHRYIGTPALSYLIDFLFDAKISDSNSGFRTFRRRRFLDWDIRSNGMEICSEVLVNCLKTGNRVAEVPITLRKNPEGRIPHLSTWRDGMRNLFIILSRAPHGFSYLGVALLLASLVVAVPSALVGHVTIGPFSLFEHHSMILAILIGYLGSQLIFYGLLLDASSKRPLAFNRHLLQIHEVHLLVLLGAVLFLTASFIVFLFVRWIQHHFNNINYLLPGLSVLYCAVVLGNLGFGIFIVRVQRDVPAPHE